MFFFWSTPDVTSSSAAFDAHLKAGDGLAKVMMVFIKSWRSISSTIDTPLGTPSVW